MADLEYSPKYVALAHLQCTLRARVQNVELAVDRLVQRGLDVNYGLPPDSPVAKHSPELVGWTALHFAVMTQNLQAITDMLQHGAKVTITDNHALSPIRLAIKCLMGVGEERFWRKGIFNHPVVELLLKAQYDQNDTSNPSCKLGLSHLHIACIVNDARMVEFLLSNGADADAAISTASPRLGGFRPVHVAARYGAVESLKLLLSHGADAGAREARGLGPLQLLMKYNQQLADLPGGRLSKHSLAYERAIKLLLDHCAAAAGPLRDEHGLERLHVVASMGDSAMLLEALNENPEIDVNAAISEKSPYWPGYTPLHFAARRGFDAIKILVERGANLAKLDASDIAPFDLCLSNMYEPKVVSEIMSLDETLKSITFTSSPLVTVCEAIASLQSTDDLGLFLDKMSNVDDPVPLSSPLWPGCTLLHLVVTLMYPQSYQHCWKKFLAEFALAGEIRKNTYEVLQYLLRVHKANPIAQDVHKCTPAHLAFRQFKPTALHYLLRHISDSEMPVHENTADLNGLTILHIGSVVGNCEFVDYLLENKYVDVDVRTTSGIRFYFKSREFYVGPGSTALHYAVTCDSSLITFLIGMDADPLAVNGDGLTPLLLAFMVMSSNFSTDYINAMLSTLPALQFETFSVNGLSHLHVACWVNSATVVRSFLDRVDVNEKINCASRHALAEYPQALKELLLLTDYEGYTPLHIAVEYKSVDVIRVLAKHGADLHARNARGLSPLHMVLTTFFAAHRKVLDCLVEVYDLKTNMPEREVYGVTALHIACQQLDLTWVKRLLEAGSGVNAQIAMHSPFRAGDTPLHVLICTYEREKWRYGRHPEIVITIAKLLIAQGADIAIPNADGYTPLHAVAATIDRDTNLLSICIDNKLKNCIVNPVNKEGLSFLHIAVMANNKEVVSQLCTQGADVNQPVDYFAENHGGRGPLHFAAMFGKLEMAELLLEKGAKANAEDRGGCTPLHVFCEYSAQCVENLISILTDHGDVNAQDACGRTPLEILMASPFEQNRAIILMYRGARLNTVNPLSGNSLLSIALSERKRYLPDILGCYFDLGGALDDDGSTALHNIVRGKVQESCVSVSYYTRVIEELLTKGCAINARDNRGRTALHVAVEHRNPTGVCSLLVAGINANIADDAGNVPLSLNPVTERIRLALLMYLHNLELLGLAMSEPNRRLYQQALQQGFPPIDAQNLLDRLRTEMDDLVGLELQGNLSLRELMSERAVREYPRMPRARREAIVNQLASSTLYERFIALRSCIRYQYRRILERIDLDEPGMHAFNFIIGKIVLPDLCVGKIVSLFDNEDLKTMIVVQKTTKRKAGNDERAKKKGKSESP